MLDKSCGSAIMGMLGTTGSAVTRHCGMSHSKPLTILVQSGASSNSSKPRADNKQARGDRGLGCCYRFTFLAAQVHESRVKRSKPRGVFLSGRLEKFQGDTTILKSCVVELKTLLWLATAKQEASRQRGFLFCPICSSTDKNNRYYRGKNTAKAINPITIR